MINVNCGPLRLKAPDRIPSEYQDLPQESGANGLKDRGHLRLRMGEVETRILG